MTNDRQIGALREEVRRAGLLSRALRLAILALLLVSVVGWAAWRQGLAHIGVTGIALRNGTTGVWSVGPAWAMFMDQWHAALGVAGAALLAGLACLKIASPWLRRRALRYQIAALPHEQRAQVLGPLQRDTSRDTRKLASALARELGLPTEVSPALTTARGNEASPGEQ
jgi:hypothetical protein